MKLFISLLVTVSLAESYLRSITFEDFFREVWSTYVQGRASRDIVTSNFVREQTVTTPMGDVTGFVTSTGWNGIEYSAFLGIPFAEPPVGELRFAEPVPAQPWTGIYDATYQRPSCLQFTGSDENESEDCLYLNVFTPDTAPDSLIPVMVFIYGGAFITGSSNVSIYSPDLLVEKNIVLVTFNYRLGPLGFLSSEEHGIPGNAGLKDQVRALEWVRENIRAFGGDPDRVTIFGESAGSASVNYHMLSPLSEGLFHRAIMQSGTVDMPWAYVSPDTAERYSSRLMMNFGCFTISCLRDVGARNIVNAIEVVLSVELIENKTPIPFAPTIEPEMPGAFLTMNPRHALRNNMFTSVPVMIGSNTQESLMILHALKTGGIMGLTLEMLENSLYLLYPYEDGSYVSDFDRHYLQIMFHNFYFESQTTGVSFVDASLDVLTDALFTIPTQQTAATFSPFMDVYTYEFSFDGSYAFYKNLLGLGNNEGVCHGDELGYMFYNDDIHRYSEDHEMVDLVTELWTNFAKTGNPTPDNSGLEKWMTMIDGPLRYMDIGENLKFHSDWYSPLGARVQFWNHLMSTMNK